MVPSMVFHARHPATWLVTALPPGTDEMSKHSAPGGDGRGAPWTSRAKPYKEWEMIRRPPLNAMSEQ